MPFKHDGTKYEQAYYKRNKILINLRETEIATMF